MDTDFITSPQLISDPPDACVPFALQHETAQRDAKNCAGRHCTQGQQGYYTT